MTTKYSQNNNPASPAPADASTATAAPPAPAASTPSPASARLNDIAVKLTNVSKVYNLYRSKKDRLKEALHPRRKKYHRKFSALNNINLEVKKGEILGIVGKNGSGKSTLLKTVASVLSPTTGTVEKHGKIIPLLELGAGFNPQFTGMENVYFYCSLLGYRKEDTDAMLDEILDFAEIGDFIHQPIKTYSSGMKARLAFAVSINVDPDILILDEVLSVGDMLFRRKCFARMETFFKGGKTILFVSHDPNSVNQLCTRAVLLDNGEILLDATPKTVTMYYEKMMFAKPENAQKIRQEIRELNISGPVEKHFSPKASGNSDVSKKVKQNQPAKEVPDSSHTGPKQKAYFIKELIPKSTMEYRNYDVDIFDAKITTPEGEKVNVIVVGDEYLYQYKVKFNIEAQNVIFGMMIKSEKGFFLSGSSSELFKQEIEKTECGSIYSVQWKLTCNLLHGVYYINSGVSTKTKENKTLLNRIVDLLCFKVQVPLPNKYGGMVYTDQKLKIVQL